MAEAPDEEEEEEDEWSEVTDEEEIYDDYALRGLRFFVNNLTGEQHDAEDIAEEIADEEVDNEPNDEEATPKPSPAYITQKLVEQGVTMEQLVKSLLKDHDEYDVEEDEFIRIDDELFGKLRIIISNYTPEESQPAPTPVETPRQPQIAEIIDYSAQPKTSAPPASRRIMIHV
jgi:hypothetical protein